MTRGSVEKHQNMCDDIFGRPLTFLCPLQSSHYSKVFGLMFVENRSQVSMKRF